MTKILLGTYYGIRESIKSGVDALKKLGYEVDEYPVMRYNRDPYDKIVDFIEHFDSHIKKSNPDVILFWTLALDYDQLSEIRRRNPNIIFAFFNWDDPHYWTIPSNDIARKSALLDLVFTCCEESVKWYEEKGTKKALFCPPAFDPSIHKYSEDDSFKYDVSICCTNMYDGEKRQKVPRRWLVDQIIGAKDISFRIYGPEHIGKQYPEHYGGYIHYEKTSKVYSNSKINICTHVIGDCEKYLNERTMLITGCGGLLYIDDIKGLDSFFVNDQDCVVIDHVDPVSQIRKILANRKDYDSVADSGKKVALSNFTYDHWAKKIDLGIQSILNGSQ